MKLVGKYGFVCLFLMLCIITAEGQNKGTLGSCTGKPQPDIKLSPKQTKDAVVRKTNFRVPPGARIEGCVYLELYISGKGEVECLNVISGLPMLTQLVSDEVMTWRFKPTGKRELGTLVPCYKDGWTLGEEQLKKD